MSHTAQIAEDYSHPEALTRAVEALGGQMIGQGTHRLFSSNETGIGFRLPGWNHPLIVRADHTLAYDNYNGRWGNVADLDRLHEEYSWALAEIAAQAMGWQTERTADGVCIFHPSDGTITVTGNDLDLTGFTGGSCMEVLRQLALPLQNLQAKPALGEIVQSVQEGI